MNGQNKNNQKKQELQKAEIRFNQTVAGLFCWRCFRPKTIQSLPSAEILDIGRDASGPIFCALAVMAHVFAI